MSKLPEGLEHLHPSEVLPFAEAATYKSAMLRSAQQLLGATAFEHAQVPTETYTQHAPEEKATKPAKRGRSAGRINRIVFENADWMAQSACKGLDPNIFFPVGENDVDAEPAKGVCGECPVQLKCLEYALTNRIAEGIWGGATEGERRRIIKQRRRR